MLLHNMEEREWTSKNRHASLIGPRCARHKTVTLVSGDLDVAFFPSSSSIQQNNPEAHTETSATSVYSYLTASLTSSPLCSPEHAYLSTFCFASI